MRVSKFQPYSLGVVAANKKLGSNIIEVTPLEDSPMLDGEINSDITTDNIDSEDSQGGQFSVTLNSANSIEAEWLPMGEGNRKTAPDVRRGAMVMLYYFADPKKLYWVRFKDDLALRKLETVVWAFSATKEEDVGVTEDAYYYFEVSSHKKLIHLHTTKKNGEPFGYDIQMNLAEGYIKIQDDAGNFFILDSAERQIAMKNSDDCYFDLNKQNLTLNVPDTLTIRAKNIVEEVGESVKTTAGSSIATETKTHTIKATSLTEQATAINVKGSGAINITGGAVTITGTPVSIN